MHKIFLIDDDAQLAEHLRTYFKRYDLDLSSEVHPQRGLEKLGSLSPDLVLLDVMLPDMDGFEVCRRIRQTSNVPIVMLTARGDVMDRVVGLELGADDYLPKPFEPRELVARVQNILKRATTTTPSSSEYVFGDLHLDQAIRVVTIEGEEIELTTMEYQLLELFVTSPGKNFTRDEILNKLKGIEADLLTRSVDILVSRLRKKLHPLDYIKTVWGAGYSFIGPKV
jgi:two-component system OmpR family response regulator